MDNMVLHHPFWDMVAAVMIGISFYNMIQSAWLGLLEWFQQRREQKRELEAVRVKKPLDK
jgi:uncharacterized protein (DUF2062 family)